MRAFLACLAVLMCTLVLSACQREREIEIETPRGETEIEVETPR